MPKYYTVKKRFEFDYAHCLSLPYESKCTNIHGHTGVLIVKIRTLNLNDEGMVIDFTHLKRILQPEIDKFDHSFVMSTSNVEDNISLPGQKITYFQYPNSTAEYFADYFYKVVSKAFGDKYDVQVEFFETPDNSACCGDW